jgi:uncharacterized metal-binding protein YceD (DUF177 family)
MTKSPILSHPVDATRIPPAGLTKVVAATEVQRHDLAAEYGLVEVKSLTGEMLLSGGEGDSFLVEGRVRAEVVQTCVVSLEPVAQHIDETIAVRFVPAGSTKAPLVDKPAAEVAIDPDAQDPPEVLDGTTVDLGAIVEEHFALAIDPYPRAPGAALPPEAVDEPAAGEDSPFAVLAGLGKPKNGV